MTDTLRVVTLCTGNRFRSPLAAAVLARAMEGHLPVEVSSLGTLRMDGRPALSEAVALAPAHGIDLSAHVSRRMARGALESADLVVGFEKFHVATAVVDGRAARGRAFTLPELVALLEGLGEPQAVDGGTAVERARALIAAAAGARGSTGRPPEIEDPFDRPPARQEAIAEEVAAQSRRLAALLAGRS
jgi:protein-tyrosine phosphatase